MTAAPGAYNHQQWMADTGALAGMLGQMAKVLDATLPYLNAVGAGRTQVTGTIALSDEAKGLAAGGEDGLRRRWDAAFRDVNTAITAARDDRAEDKQYAQ